MGPLLDPKPPKLRRKPFFFVERLSDCGMVLSGDVLDLGLVVAASLDSGCAHLLTLLEALASVRLHDVAFQLRPRPRVGMRGL